MAEVHNSFPDLLGLKEPGPTADPLQLTRIAVGDPLQLTRIHV